MNQSIHDHLVFKLCRQASFHKLKQLGRTSILNGGISYIWLKSLPDDTTQVKEILIYHHFSIGYIHLGCVGQHFWFVPNREPAVPSILTCGASIQPISQLGDLAATSVTSGKSRSFSRC